MEECSGGRAPAVRTSYAPDLDAEELAFQRLYGPWRPLSLGDVKSLFTSLEIPWWIAGGYAIEAFTGVLLNVNVRHKARASIKLTGL